MAGSVILLVTSPRLPAEVLTAQAWDLVRAHPVLTASESAQVSALRAAGASVTVMAPSVDELLAHVDAHGTVVWLASPPSSSPSASQSSSSLSSSSDDGSSDARFARELGLRLAREPGLAELELVYGSWDPAGARLLDVVTVMDRLMHPEAGDPWKRAQTHASLAHFLLEESYELYDAIRDDDTSAVREELGDVLLQVILHARLAEETSGFTIDDVAGDLVAKLIRRNPHVFADTEVGGIDEIIANWEQIKKAEKSRASTVDGVALSQPALALTAKLLQRVERASLPVPLPPPTSLGGRLFAAVAEARSAGEDAEAALREAALHYMDTVRATELNS
ncbi:MazG family protein [Dactylosporangium vinaceum]|uniref:MazG family protein n=1 Tax=Dactylosporangium vinaceum TaxID=53362 RepID=A0ABV5LYN4_9ACTN|nr:MazG family protein [Dactylosporangium vinaceum]UAB95882.1 MazG family protein [Dactylosporangium vinaceum]